MAVDVLLHVVLAMAVIIVVSRSLGAVFRRLEQPAVIGELTAGILLGPSLLGRIAPGLFDYLMPPTPFDAGDLRGEHGAAALARVGEAGP